MEEQTGRPIRSDNCLSLKRKKVTNHPNNHITKPNKIKLRQHKSTPAQQILRQKKSGNVPARDSNPRPSVCKANTQTIGPVTPADIQQRN